MATDRKRPKARRKSAKSLAPLREIVGDDTYDTCVAMLRELVPEGRTHRLSVLVASMLQYASCVAWSRRNRANEEDPAYPLLVATDGVDEEEAIQMLEPMLVRLFNDAKVDYERVSSRGDRYSISRGATSEFLRWYNYMWEY